MGNGQLSLFLLYVFLCQLFGFSSSLFHLCPKDQALALLNFKHMFTITPYVFHCYYKTTHKSIESYPKTVTWNTSTDCCSWAGVYCDETTGQVIELDLSCSQLQGKFHPNSSLFQLSNLKRLDLSRNDFSQSYISPKFGEFSSLTHLDLSASNMSGPIPSEISHLSKLRVLRISRFYAHDQDVLRLGPHNFKLLVNNLTKLTELELIVNISSTIPLNFSSFLTYLQLSDTQLFGILPERVFHLPNLKSLYLSSNPQLTVRFPKTKWNSSESLEELYLNGVNFIDTIPQSFSYLTSLRQLDMRSCNLSGSIPRPLRNLTNIEILLLDNNHLEGPIPLFIFTKLIAISLQNNNFEFLSFNGSCSPTLGSLDISSNSLTGPIPSNVSGLQSLNTLYLSYNHLNGTIPSWIFALPSLEWLDLSGNTFSGKIQEFASKTLYYVSVHDNLMQGPIPESLINNQPHLNTLSLSQNNLTGQIASTICKLTMLSLLDVGSNKFVGPIPQCLGEMNMLRLLDVSNNSLSGTIDITFGIGNELKIINVDMNKLEGKVPPSLINCKYLGQLDLGNNELNDTFPKWLGALPDLRILSLRSNKLHGPLNVSRTENFFAQLRIMDLSSNGFSGKLPASLFENFQAMKIINENMTTSPNLGVQYDSLTITTKGLDLQFIKVSEANIVIDLSNNRFEGYIPSIIGDLIELRTLNLSHNNLKGHIPASLHQLSVVESLDLSFNRISGEIPQQLSSLTFLEVLNLSHNHLVGCIPKGKQFDTFGNSSYEGNDGLRGFPLSKDCGSDDGTPQEATQFGLDQEEEGDSSIINWQAVLMGYGCGLVIVLSLIYIMLSTQYPPWFSRLFEELEYKIITRMEKHRKRN